MKKRENLVLVFVILALFSSLIKFGGREKQTYFLTNRCPQEKEKPPVLLGPFSPKELPNGWIRYKQPGFGFVFDTPGNQWYVQQNIIQEFEEPLAFPKIEYSLYFSHPVSNVNSTHWEERQKAALYFLVFKNNCQDLKEWLRLIPKNEKTEQEEIEVDGKKGIRLKNLRGYQDDEMIIFNEDPYHYQFRLQVRYPEDLPEYSKLLTQIIETFNFLKVEKNEENL